MANKGKLALLKYNATKLRASYQIPSYLAYLILHLTGKEETKYVKTLMDFSIHMLRIKDYYKRFPDVDKQCTEEIKNGLKELGF